MKVAEWQGKKRSMGIFNVGSGSGHSINQICDIVESITGRNLERIYCAERNIDVRSVVLNGTKIMQQYAWHTKTDIVEGIQSTWEWLQRNVR